MPGGAMDPAIAAHGELVFSSPVPKAGRLWTSPEPAALYRQMPGQEPSRLTFGRDSAVGATVLRDGRVLFVTAEPRDNRHARRHLCLFTINNDGTEVTAYACQEDGVDFIRRPRELGDGRIAFLAARMEEPGPMGLGGVREIGRSLRDAGQPVRLPERRLPLGGAGRRKATCWPVSKRAAGVGRSMMGNAAVFRVAADATGARCSAL